MSVYLVGAIDIVNPDGYEKYRAGQGALFAEHGLELLSGDDHPEILEGAKPAGHLFIVKFSSMDKLHAFFGSDTYQSIVHHRHESANTRFIMAMRGPDEPA
jgi:uncharacterized protein (DUF1330 family)